MLIQYERWLQLHMERQKFVPNPAEASFATCATLGEIRQTTKPRVDDASHVSTWLGKAHTHMTHVDRVRWMAHVENSNKQSPSGERLVLMRHVRHVFMARV
jgi:hypothetical protein